MADTADHPDPRPASSPLDAGPIGHGPPGSYRPSPPLVRDETVPGRRWAFDEGVTAAFDDMLARSIPDHAAMRQLVAELGLAFARTDTYSSVLDLGCSRGEALAPFVDAGWRAFGVDVSEPMLELVAERFPDLAPSIAGRLEGS